MNQTTEVFSRTSRPSGSEYAASIERKRRRRDWSGIIIIAGCVALYWVPVTIWWWVRS